MKALLEKTGDRSERAKRGEVKAPERLGSGPRRPHKHYSKTAATTSNTKKR
jgi:hypothetical protein